MKLANKVISKFKDQKGAVAIVVGLALFFFIVGFAALAIDVGYLYATRNELQNIADSAALAATGELGDQYYKGETIDIGEIKSAAVDAGSKNHAAEKLGIIIDLDDIEIGNWDSAADPPSFTASSVLTGDEDAVRVRARRQNDPRSADGPVGTFFAKIFGFETANLQADATAALSGVGHVVTGGLPLPIGIGKVRFDDPDWCGEPIKFYPSNDIEACGGWHNFEDDKTKLKQDILDGMLPLDDPDWISPFTEGGDFFWFKGGTDTSAWFKIKEIFDNAKVVNDYFDEDGEIKEWPLDGDMDPNVWTATVVVYDKDDCGNPNDRYEIIGFAAVNIYEICTSLSDPDELITGGGAGSNYPLPDLPLPPEDHCLNGEKKLVARIACDFVKAQRGSGGEYGIMGNIPGLVE